MTANLSPRKTIKITFLAAQLQTAYSVVSQVILLVYDLSTFYVVIYLNNVIILELQKCLSKIT